MTGPISSATALLTRVTRSERIESFHRGSVAVVENDKVTFSLGDPHQMVYARSAVKPLQALPLVERRQDLSPPELALLSASHNGTPRHVEVAEGLLARGEFGEQDLRCGPHPPFDKAAALALARSGGKPNRLHNNCSGKHAGFLLLARELDADPESYLDPESRTQQVVRESVAAMTGVESEQLAVGVDGCGAPAFWMPLAAIARGFQRLTNPDGLGPVRERACRTLFDAVTKEPVLLAGEGRLSTALVRALPGRVYPKNGAEGVYALGVAGRNLGLAIKVADGNERGYLPVVVDAIRALGLVDPVPESLGDFHRVPVRNTQRRQVGEVTCSVDWPW